MLSNPSSVYSLRGRLYTVLEPLPQASIIQENRCVAAEFVLLYNVIILYHLTYFFKQNVIVESLFLTNLLMSLLDIIVNIHFHHDGFNEKCHAICSPAMFPPLHRGLVSEHRHVTK